MLMALISLYLAGSGSGVRAWDPAAPMEWGGDPTGTDPGPRSRGHRAAQVGWGSTGAGVQKPGEGTAVHGL